MSGVFCVCYYFFHLIDNCCMRNKSDTWFTWCTCVQCIIENINEKTPVCPYKGCGVKVADPGKVVENCKIELEQLYPTVQASVDVEELQHCVASSTDQRINIVMLTGDTVSLPFNPLMTVERLKTEIKNRFAVEEIKQQLMYNDRVLEVCTVNSILHHPNNVVIINRPYLETLSC